MAKLKIIAFSKIHGNIKTSKKRAIHVPRTVISCVCGAQNVFPAPPRQEKRDNGPHDYISNAIFPIVCFARGSAAITQWSIEHTLSLLLAAALLFPTLYAFFSFEP